MAVPRIRVTVRRLMVAVIFVALSLGFAAWMKRRSERFEAVAARHEFSYMTVSPYSPTNDPRQKYIDYDMMMGKKYRRAARFPWLPVEPDPPAPE